MKNTQIFARRSRSCRMIAAALTLCAVVAAASGCTPGKKFPDAKTVGMAMPAKSLERWNRDGQYLKEQFEQRGYNVELRYSDNDSYKQNNDIECLIADNVDLLIISAVDGVALTQTLKNAKDANIPVIAYDRLIMNSDAVSYYVSFNNYRIGELLAEFAIDSLDLEDDGDFRYGYESAAEKPVNIEFLSGDVSDNNAHIFYNGAMDKIKEYIDKGDVIIPSGKTAFEQVAIPGGWTTDVALKCLQDILASFYSDGKKLDAVICANDTIALGAAQAIGSDYSGSNYPVLTGQDGDAVNLRMIEEGKLAMTIYKNQQDEAAVTIDVAEALLSGTVPDETLLASLSAEAIYDNSSFDNGKITVPSFLLESMVVTKSNINKLVEIEAFVRDENTGYLVPAT